MSDWYEREKENCRREAIARRERTAWVVGITFVLLCIAMA